jgi:hypothetical protein
MLVVEVLVVATFLRMIRLLAIRSRDRFKVDAAEREIPQ